ncbi:bacillithiol biosynthesis cysteine-adding enzyme BshC [Bacillus sp. FJAT-29790]|uniref:bacillithiol biosynthesis cysteine-adding enzyme BshC n=1 Tax=Bacillus sp. FJAT-29790 TaxID=1895002 RepID=UPI001C23C14C|nr:bacillithiol biosynthesis cysteine-adding enzyme BshC [Bacillus sp. FJAT-29790]MBU8877714.1 bacillithiol biosynthesis cysteine-adding enzyme BshC [Bacillus sp. FJAT-29790]
MEMLNLSLPATNRFATEYMAQTEDIQRYFHYRYNDIVEYKNRLDELKDRSFMRKELAAHIEQFMAGFPTSEKVLGSLEKLKKENSAVIIGGQQAGILTGPLYTIHKIISIIALAKQKEEELNIPVVPVFWIAGEDHDYQEVNHVYIEKDHKLEKRVYPEKVLDKRMVSNVQIDREVCLNWAEEIIESFGETAHTKELHQVMKKAISESKSFVDLFAYIIMYLFKDSGLLIIDSGDEKIRTIEKEFFIKQMKSFKEITKGVKRQQDELAHAGYSNTIEISDKAVNLFYYDEDNKERVLLEYDDDKKLFIGKDGFFQFSWEQMSEIAGEFPEKLSNNVVTRPLMQEWLFPTLAFIAGPGEIAYWAELKQVFEMFGLKMPPIVPRLNMTFLDRSIETDMNELELNLQETLTFGTEKTKEEFIQSLKDQNLESLFRKTKQDLFQNYRLIEEYMKQEDKGLVPLFEKNEELLLKQIEFLKSKLENSVQMKHEVVIRKYDRVGNALRPNGAPQERIANGLFYLNQYGLNFMNELLKCSFSFDGTHKVIKI